MKQLTEDGDCGTLLLDVQGAPWYMHHVIVGDSNGFKSFGVPLSAIMESHSSFFGGDTAIQGAVMVSHESTCVASPIGDGSVSSPLKKSFKTKGSVVAPLKYFKTKPAQPDNAELHVVAPLLKVKTTLAKGLSSNRLSLVLRTGMPN
jgi:hypothetical protein